LKIKKAMEDGAFKNFLLLESQSNKSLEKNMDMKERTGYKPVYLEHNVSGAINDMLLNGRIDRVDSCGNGTIVYDYKTGRPPWRRRERERERIDMLQIPLYLHLLSSTNGTVPMGGFYYYLGEENSRIENLFEDRNIDGTINGMISVRVPAITESIKEGYFPRSYIESKYMASDPCKHCEMGRICKQNKDRIRDYGPFARYYMGWRQIHGW